MPRSQGRLKRIQTALVDWFQKYGRDLPWRRTRDPYHILVSEIMLQQTQVDRVIPKYQAFLQRFPTLADLAAAPAGDVIRAWAGLGYNRRALNLQRAATAVLTDYGGQFPDTPETLRQLPGIGPYTAGAVACFAFERDVAFMDTNIRRVIRRVFAGPETDEHVVRERDLLEMAAAAVPPGAGYSWNQAIMELGALVCVSARPRCTICPLRSECKAYAEWKKADEQIFSAPPVARRAVRVVAEQGARYTTSNRYYRGRIVALLRDLPPNAALSVVEIGPLIKEDWSAVERPWLLEVVKGLVTDGLIVFEGDLATEAKVRLP